MARMINSAGLEIVKEFEGLRLEAYPDQADPPVWTIGHGHTRGVYEDQTCSQMQADAWLEADLMVSEAEVQRVVKVPLTDNQFSALVSFAFNEKGFAGSTMVIRLNAGEYDAVPEELPKWKYAGHKVQPGLVKRRAAEAALWSTK